MAAISSAQEADKYSSVTSITVSDVFFKDTRTLNVLKAIAERYKVVIGVSGVLVGPDRHGITFTLEKGTVADILNIIVRQDTRFEWHEDSDGVVSVSVRNGPLSLTNVRIKNFGVENPRRYELVENISDVPEIHDWLHEHSCEVMEMIAGRPQTNTLVLSLHVSNGSLRSVLDDISRTTGSYFWSAIQFHTDPCAINLNP